MAVLSVLEKRVQNEIFREFGTRSDLRIWRANRGSMKIGDRFIEFGIDGQADITGILPDGRRLEIECKRRIGGKQSKDQENFEALITRFGGIYILARSVEDVFKALSEKGYSV